MLEKPKLADDTILSWLQENYGLQIIQIEFLPLGADENTAVYLAVDNDKGNYFVKVRKGSFDETAVRLPIFLSEEGIKQIIAPIPTNSGQLYTNQEAYKLILYPFVEGRDGYETKLTDDQWIEFGKTIRSIHDKPIPAELKRNIPEETFSSTERNKVVAYLELIHDNTFTEPISADLAAFLNEKREVVRDLIERAKRLADKLRERSAEYVTCHSDLHAGNVLVDDKGQLFIVDWDNPIQAPKERDLMFAGGGQFRNDRSPMEEEALFYEGYGKTKVNPDALAYYRYERIIEDIAAFCEQISGNQQGDENRVQSLKYLKSIFLPGNTIEITYLSDRAQMEPGENSRV